MLLVRVQPQPQARRRHHAVSAGARRVAAVAAVERHSRSGVSELDGGHAEVWKEIRVLSEKKQNRSCRLGFR